MHTNNTEYVTKQTIHRTTKKLGRVPIIYLGHLKDRQRQADRHRDRLTQAGRQAGRHRY
jgi:hypothetical protein